MTSPSFPWLFLILKKWGISVSLGGGALEKREIMHRQSWGVTTEMEVQAVLGMVESWNKRNIRNPPILAEATLWYLRNMT